MPESTAGMRLQRVSGSVMSQLEDDLQSRLMSLKGWWDAGIRVKVKYGGESQNRDYTWYKVILCLDEHGHNVISELAVHVDGVYGDQIILHVRPRSMTKHHGQVDDDWHRQNWRTDPFLAECSAQALWPWLEINANLTGIVEDVLKA